MGVIANSSARRRRWTRAAPLVLLAAVAFAAGTIVGARPGQAERAVVNAYIRAWARNDYARMYALLDSASRRQITEPRFAADYQRDARIATLLTLRALRVPGPSAGVIHVAMLARTQVFGMLRQTLLVPLDDTGPSPTIRFARTLLFPGLLPGERLSRHTMLAPRASLLARDGTPMAEGPDRTSPIASIAAGIVGTLGPIPPDERDSYQALGYPPGALIGMDGLEWIFQGRLAGTPGGTLSAGARVLASTAPRPGSAVRTSIDPAIEAAAIQALAGRYGGIAAMDPRTGQLLALVGIAFSAIQPPGSTMKIITSTAALQAGIVKLTDTFPIATSATIDGYQLSNASGEACGGTLLNAFAVSCNSVFAPLGVRLGARRLVAAAERFGFNQSPSIPGAAESQIPPAGAIGSALAVGSSAIGQGRVQASALEMTDVAATIAMRGRRPIPTLLVGQAPRFVPVTSRRVAGLVQRMMIAVVQYGTGTPAAIPGVTVAGKTGTAQVVNSGPPNSASAKNPKNTDSWFVGYAPARSPRIVVGGLFPNQGAGAETAAPAVREVLLAALQSRY
jgi:penicillin-binding protein A